MANDGSPLVAESLAEVKVTQLQQEGDNAMERGDAATAKQKYGLAQRLLAEVESGAGGGDGEGGVGSPQLAALTVGLRRRLSEAEQLPLKAGESGGASGQGSGVGEGFGARRTPRRPTPASGPSTRRSPPWVGAGGTPRRPGSEPHNVSWERPEPELEPEPIGRNTPPLEEASSAAPTEPLAPPPNLPRAAAEAAGARGAVDDDDYDDERAGRPSALRLAAAEAQAARERRAASLGRPAQAAEQPAPSDNEPGGVATEMERELQLRLAVTHSRLQAVEAAQGRAGSHEVSELERLLRSHYLAGIGPRLESLGVRSVVELRRLELTERVEAVLQLKKLERKRLARMQSEL